MQCPEFESRLNAILDQRRDPAADELLAAHAAFCEPCDDLLAAQLAVLNTMNRLRRADLAVARPKLPARSPASLSLRLALAVAAAMLLALGLVWQMRGRQSRLSDVARRGGQSIGVGRGSAAFAVASPGRPLIREPRLSGGDWLLEAPRVPHHLRACRATFDQLATSLPSALQRLDEFDQYAPGLSNLRASFGVIWQTLVPPLSSAPQEGPAALEEPRTTGMAPAAPLLA